MPVGEPPLGGLPAGPEDVRTSAALPIKPPGIRRPVIASAIVCVCACCQEQDRKGERLFRWDSGGAFTCGTFQPGCDSGKDAGNGAGFIVQLAALLKQKRCGRGHWDRIDEEERKRG